MSHKLSDYDDAPPDEELPSYEDVIKQEAQAGSSSQSSHRPSSQSSHRPSRPPPPGRPSSSRPPPPRPPRPTVPSSNTAPVSNIPWVYPRGFHCPKCNNTGYKTKNGKSCKSCWRRFARQNNTSMSQTSYGGGYQSSPIYPQQQQQMPYQQMQYQPMQMAPTRPLYVRPGDPRIGGVVCGNCRGSGRIRFLLDEDICGVCNGLGRIIGR